jgi:hypothetical protein
MTDIKDSLLSNLDKAFNVEEIRGELICADEGVPAAKDIAEVEDDSLSVDFDKTRSNIELLLKKATPALESAVSLASSSESPRAIEALSTLLKTISDINAGYLDAQLKVAQIKNKKGVKEDSSTPPANVSNTLVFNGTTKELKEFLDKED